jgi:hypothetical protein
MVGGPHQARFGLPAAPAREQPDRDPDGQHDELRDEGHRQRHLGTVDRASQQVPAEHIGSQRVGSDHPGRDRSTVGNDRVEVLLVVVVGQQQRSDEGDQDEGGDDHQANDAGRGPQQAADGVAPEPPARREPGANTPDARHARLSHDWPPGRS